MTYSHIIFTVCDFTVYKNAYSCAETVGRPRVFPSFFNKWGNDDKEIKNSDRYILGIIYIQEESTTFDSSNYLLSFLHICSFFNHSNKLPIIPSILDMLKFSVAFIALWQLVKIEVCRSLLRWDLKIVALNPINNLKYLIISRVQKEEENYLVPVVSQSPRRTECCLGSVFQSGGKNNQRPSRSIMGSFIPLTQAQETEDMKASLLIMHSLQGQGLSMYFLWQHEDSTVEKRWVTKWA